MSDHGGGGHRSGHGHRSGRGHHSGRGNEAESDEFDQESFDPIPFNADNPDLANVSFANYEGGYPSFLREEMERNAQLSQPSPAPAPRRSHTHQKRRREHNSSSSSSEREHGGRPRRSETSEAPASTQAPVPQTNLALPPHTQEYGARAPVAFMGSPAGGNIPPPQGGGGAHFHPYVTHYEQEQANLGRSFPQASGMLGFAPQPLGGQYYGGYPAQAQGGSIAQGAYQPPAPQRRAEQAPAQPESPVRVRRVEWNGDTFALTAPRAEGQRGWTREQMFELWVIAASFISWAEAASLGQAFPAGHSQAACKMRWAKVHRHWTEEEDAKFLAYYDDLPRMDGRQRAERVAELVRWFAARSRSEAEVQGRIKLFERWGKSMQGQNIGTGQGMSGARAYGPKS